VKAESEQALGLGLPEIKITAMKIQYKGYTIEQETEPWAVKYNRNFKFYPTDEGVDGNFQHAETLEEAKDEISERVFLETYPERWAVEHSKSLAPVQWDFLSDAMKFTVQWDAMPLFKFNSI
jgi:hypothetical protein